MKRYNYPLKELWSEICSRPNFNQRELENDVKAILDSVKADGDKALYSYTEKFDSVKLKELIVSQNEIQQAQYAVSNELKLAIQEAKKNIEKFHLGQKEEITPIETTEGVLCLHCLR